MNYVIRVKTDSRSFILKQARPWVEKYPGIQAPIERILVEIKYYKAIANNETLSASSPRILFVDIANYLFILEDLGDVQDFSFVYNEIHTISDKEINDLAQYLQALHQVDVEDFPLNTEMRKLNYEHIFDIPFKAENGLDLNHVQAGLQSLAFKTQDPATRKVVECLGQLYLSAGTQLLHGDFYPGSWMKSDRLFVLDPEFSFCGPIEFDLGVCIAHFKIADQSDASIQLFLDTYALDYNKSQVFAFAGIEIIRRLLGVAQLPLQLELQTKSDLLDMSVNWIRQMNSTS